MSNQEPPRDQDEATESQANLFVWPALMAAAASGAFVASLASAVRLMSPPESKGANMPEPVWATAHHIRLDLTTMRLRDFSTHGDGVATLVCAPYALHGATVADFATGHSLVGVLRDAGLGRVHVTDWRSAEAQMRFLSIDSLLAEFNVAVDELDPPVDLVGLCQGGWMVLAYAARFPLKVRRIVVAGAPVDIAAAPSLLAQTATHIPQRAFEEFVRAQGGRVRGQNVLQLWGSALNANDELRVLQIPREHRTTATDQLLRRFREWYETTIDLPGTYYLQVVLWLFKENQLATGRFVALGRRIDLAAINQPLFLLVARDDELVAADQLLRTAAHVGTPRPLIETATTPCGHLSLFIGAKTLASEWPRIARWLAAEHLPQAV